MADKIITRTDTFDNWESVNPILEQGEQAWDSSNKKMKVGDGATSWNDLEYATGGNKEIDEVKHKVLSGTGRITIPHEVAGNTVKLYIDKGTANVGDTVKITVQSRNLINKEMFCDPNNWESVDGASDLTWKPHKGEASLYLSRKGKADLGNRSIGTRYERMTGAGQKRILYNGLFYLKNVEPTERETFYDEYLEELQLERHGFTDIIPYSKVEYNIPITEKVVEITVPNVYLYSTIECNNVDVMLIAEYNIPSLAYEISTLKGSEEKLAHIGATPLVIKGKFEDNYDYFKPVEIFKENLPLIYLILLMVFVPGELFAEEDIVTENMHNVIDMYNHGLREISVEAYSAELRPISSRRDGLDVMVVNKDTHFAVSFCKDGEQYRAMTSFLDKWNRTARIQIASLQSSGEMVINTESKKIYLKIATNESTLLWGNPYVSAPKLELDYNRPLPEYINTQNISLIKKDYTPGENDKYYRPYELVLGFIGEVTEEIVRKDFGSAIIDVYRS